MSYKHRLERHKGQGIFSRCIGKVIVYLRVICPKALIRVFLADESFGGDWSGVESHCGRKYCQPGGVPQKYQV